MLPFLKLILRRLLAIPVTMLILTAVIYAVLLQTPAEVRAQLYLSKIELTRGNLIILTERAIEKHGLDDPFPVQYLRWLGRMARGDWGYAVGVRDDVLPALLARSAVTAELTLFALIAAVPLGLVSGVLAGGRQQQPVDYWFRATAFAATAIPSFILGLVLLSVFYTGLRWFAPQRLSNTLTSVVRSAEFQTYTGLLTVDGLLNGRTDVSLDALRHLALPVTTLSLAQWATLGRVTRVSVVDELRKDYVISAHARGLRPRRVLWRHVFRNAMAPALTSSALTAASLLTGVFIVEIIFDLHGITELVDAWSTGLPVGPVRIPDTAAIVGLLVYSSLAVQLLMLALDVLQAVVNPRLRDQLEAG
jgi:peptide/nickel transport system permease protein